MVGRALSLVAVFALVAGMAFAADPMVIGNICLTDGSACIADKDCVKPFPAGSVVTLTAKPQPGYVFTGWQCVTGYMCPCRGTWPVCTFTMPVTDVPINALFKKKPPQFKWRK